MPIGGCVSLRVISGIRSVASSSPSMSTASGFRSSRYARSCHAPIGDRWRTPNTLICHGETATSRIVLRTGLIQRPPFGPALLEDVGEVLLPYDAVLFFVLHDRALQPRGEIGRRHTPGAKTSGERH